MAENKQGGRKNDIDRGGARGTQRRTNERASEDGGGRGGGGGVLRGEDVGGVQISPPLRSEKRETRDARQR